MFERSDRPRLFALPPGTDFPEALVEGLVARLDTLAPEQAARVELYVNTRRMMRRIREMFDAGGPRILPRLRLVTDLGRDPLAGLPPAVPPLRRRLELARLVQALLAREPDFAAGTAVYDLADSLAALMDEMQSEGVAPARLDDPRLAEDHAAHWERSLAFIRIVARYFEADAPPDPEARQRRVVEALVARWAEAPPDHPVIVAGSTGSRGATALFLEAVARLPQGAAVLPGYDFDMPESVWNSLDSGPMPAEDHPQYRFRRLVRALGLAATEVRPWTSRPAPSPARNRLVSLALRPAPVTDQWMAEGPLLPDLAGATAGLSLIEAPSPRIEALAIALVLRQAAEEGGRAALITPDRMLTRRVIAALDRWGIMPDDSAGRPLALTPPGRLLRHVAALFGQRLTVEALLTLLKHPLVHSAGARGEHLRHSRDLELALRRRGPAFPAGADLLAWAARQEDAGRDGWARWLAETLDGVETPEDLPLAAHVARHLGVTEALAAGPGGAGTGGLWQEAAGEEARRAMAELSCEAGHGGSFAPADYADLVGALLQAGSVRQSEVAHPAISIWGTIEARVQGADLVILAGLNEGIWPELPAPDPWLSRRMRHQAGLLSPERRIGLAAHDFQQAVAAPEVVLSRALRDDEAQTVASRWLNRLTNLLRGLEAAGGAAALAGMRGRGQRWAELALALEEPRRKVPPAPRPAPRPPVAARPAELPVTGISRLIRDPYAVYARHILRLRPLDPLKPSPDARLRGTALHKVVETFIRERPEAESPEAARARLLATAATVLDETIPWPSARRFWLARLDRAADRFILDEAGRQARGRPVLLERPGAVRLDGGFTLTARPDRIDLFGDGRVHIYDYKTGEPPSPKEQEAFEKQLLLEAAMAERGGFAEIGPRPVEGVTYIGLLGRSGAQRNDLADGIATRTWEELHRLIAAYGRRETGYISRRAVKRERFEGDYDHLARFGEWEMSDPSEPEDVG